MTSLEANNCMNINLNNKMKIASENVNLSLNRGDSSNQVQSWLLASALCCLSETKDSLCSILFNSNSVEVQKGKIKNTDIAIIFSR